MNEKKQFVFDEWIFTYLADETKAGRMVLFLEKMLNICDKFVLTPSTPLASKLYQFQSQRRFATPRINEAIKFFTRAIFWNSDKKFEIFSLPEISEEHQRLLPRKDVYLVQMALATTSKIIITTDSGLITSLNSNREIFGVTVFEAEKFISEYLG